MNNEELIGQLNTLTSFSVNSVQNRANLPDKTITIFARSKRHSQQFRMSFLRNLFSKKTLINLIAAMLVGVLIIWGVFAWLDHYTCHGCAITVPDLRGYTVDLVEDITAKKDLRFVVLDSIYDENAERGAVVDQDPKPGAQVKENRRIYLIINKSVRESVAMEDVTDLSPRQAMATLKAMGLDVGALIPRPSPFTDLVLDQHYKGEVIEPGTMIKKGETIDLVVASGASGEKTLVPLLVGYNLKEAETILLNNSLNLGAPIFLNCENCQTAEDSATMSRIYKQRPMYGVRSLVELGAYIDVWLTTDSATVPKKIEMETPEKNDDSEN